MPCRYFDGASKVNFGDIGPWVGQTYCAWVYPEAIADQTIYSQYRDTRNEYNFIGFDSSGFARAQSRRSSSTTASATTTIPYKINKWHFIAGVFASTTSRTIYMFCDGVWHSVTNTTSVSMIGTGTGVGAAGYVNDSTWSAYLTGKIGLVASFGRVLTLSELQMFAFNPSKFTKLNQSLLCFMGGTNPEIDYSGNKKHGTLTRTVLIPNDSPPIDTSFKGYKPNRVFRFPVFGLENHWADSFVLANAPAAVGGGGSAIYTMCLMGV